MIGFMNLTKRVICDTMHDISRSILEYAEPVWNTYLIKYIKRLESRLALRVRVMDCKEIKNLDLMTLEDRRSWKTMTVA